MYAHRRNASFQVVDWLSWQVIAGAFVIGLALTCISLSFLFSTRRVEPALVVGTAFLYVTEASTITPTLPPEAVIPTAEPSSAASGDSIRLEAYVQISGTGGTGLRLRSEPGLNGSVLVLGGDGEVFVVKDGPRQVDGYEWWYLVGPYDEKRAGWAVANYLLVVQNP